MMKVTIDPAIQSNASLTFALERVNATLSGIFRKLANVVEVRWTLTGPQKWSPLYLEIQYEDKGSGISIDQNELEDVGRLEAKLLDLWGDLLQARLDGIVHRLQTMTQEVETAS